MDTIKHYDKYYLKKNPATNEILTDGKKQPILGELAKHDCPLEPRHVTTLNRGWQNSGVYFVEVKKEEPKQPEKTEIKKEGGKTPTKKELVSECGKSGLDTNGNVKELTERLANHKG